MITDSYPDSDGNQRLMVFDSQTLKGIIIAKLAAPLYWNPASCDLHPKLSYGQNMSPLIPLIWESTI